ncbi:MAG: SusC/RagA family TonB-linked outer membrane protein [Salinivirgaceae bacterium]|nr:SusC/RagA family TonB-linked outer membrane protein [Salinivirgaceae bacterium]
MKKIAMLIVCLLFLGAQLVSAQNKTLTGTVISSEDNQPLPGVNVVVKGTTHGTITDFDGKFTLSVSDDAEALTFSFMGMQTQEVAIGTTTTFNITLDPESISMDEVVVTAMGITRAEKTLGYAATTVKSDDIVTARTTDVTNALSGRVAGVQVNSTSSDPGAVSNIVIRGFSSIKGSNQPLYVVDGVPLQNNMFSGASGVETGKNVSLGGISNIASEDIESMTILKGAAATALYGSRAANGVVVITTKSGKKGVDKNFSIEYSGSVQARQVSLLPEFQNEFGQGWNGTQTFIENGSWGPKFDGSNQIYGPIWNYQQLFHKYSAVETNVKDFFELGWSQSHHISLRGVSDDDKLGYYVSYSHTSDDGIMPDDYDKYKRNTLEYRGSFKSDYFTISSSMNFARTKTDDVSAYQGVSVIDGLYEMARDVSIVDKKDLSSAFNTPEAYFTPYGITNPYWALANNYSHTDSKQVFGKMQVDIKPIEPLTFTYRMGFDYTDYNTKVGTPEIALDDALINENYGYAPSSQNQAGYIYTRYGRSYETNNDIMATFNKRFADDKLDVNVVAGLNIVDNYLTRTVSATEKLAVPGFWNLRNGADKKTLDEYEEQRRTLGAFGDVTLGWDDMIYLELTGRNDWSSTLPKDKNSYFYPGATLSWIFTKMMESNGVLSFGKARLAFGRTGNDAKPYQVSASYSQGAADGYYGSNIARFPMNGVNAFQVSSVAGSSDLRPEMTTEAEFGLNLQFLNGRVGIDASAYNRVTDDQIFDLPVDPACGYTRVVTNFGKLRNRGFEILVNTTPVKTNAIRWDVDVNFAINKNKVLSLPKNLDGGKVSIYSFASGNDAVYMYAEEGKALGEFYTYLPQYTEDGKIIVDDKGDMILGTEVEATGKNMNNKWTGGVTTSLSAYGFTLSAALDVRYGGYMFSRTKNLMQFTGNSVVTTYNERNPFVIPNSVVRTENADGSYTYSENTNPLYLYNSSYQTYFNDYGWGSGGEAYLINRSYAKLRNISLSYALPKSILEPVRLADASISIFCNNVYTWTAKDNRYIDPETTTISQANDGDLATQFGELYANPACRIFGVSLGVKF